MPVEEGKKAPAFTLADASGKKVALGDLAGKNVVVYFYPKDDTPGCTKEACYGFYRRQRYRSPDRTQLPNIK
jgi:peroxiredoxin Q/BCP